MGSIAVPLLLFLQAQSLHSMATNGLVAVSSRVRCVLFCSFLLQVITLRGSCIHASTRFSRAHSFIDSQPHSCLLSSLHTLAGRQRLHLGALPGLQTGGQARWLPPAILRTESLAAPRSFISILWRGQLLRTHSLLPVAYV